MFTQSYKVALRNEFVKNNDSKAHGFKSHVHGFLTLLGLNNRNIEEMKLKRFEVRPVRFTVNA